MRQALQYPFDLATLLRRRKALKAELLAEGELLARKVAILGGSTTADVRDLLELFLLGAGIRPVFFECDYARFYEAAVVDDAALRAFAPDVVFVHTTHHNVRAWPALLASPDQCDAALAEELTRFRAVWDRLLADERRLVIQNNFDPPPLEPVGHLGSVAGFGRQHFVSRLNAAFAAEAQRQPRLRINDIARLAALTGLQAWAAPRYWVGYRMAVAPAGAVALAHQAAKIIRAAFGRSHKCLVLDLDNTLWGGVIGDDGVANLRLGHDTPEGEAYLAFQRYCLDLKARGVLLAVCSKNDPATARLGFDHPDSALKVSDFSAFLANWEPKPDNLRRIARDLNLGLDSLVFVDDNPFERELVAASLPEVTVAKVGDVTSFAEVLDREGHFEPFALTADDLPRAAQYAANTERAAARAAAPSYDAYLASLEMVGEIGPFLDVYLERITQLTNKTNQFNLTTRRYSLGEITGIQKNPEYLTLYGRLKDRFGDNGLVSVLIGHARGDALHLDLWLMSCRVLQRSFELAMFDALCAAACARGLRRLVGTYLRTERNAMVAGHYQALGFACVERTPDGSREVWNFDLPGAMAPRCVHIRRA